MTWNSTMSSGYSSLEEDSEEYFFTARTSFFRKPLGKVSESKVRAQNTRLLSAPDRWMKIIRCFKVFFFFIIISTRSVNSNFTPVSFIHGRFAGPQTFKCPTNQKFPYLFLKKQDATFLGKENPPSKVPSQF